MKSVNSKLKVIPVLYQQPLNVPLSNSTKDHLPASCVQKTCSCNSISRTNFISCTTARHSRQWSLRIRRWFFSGFQQVDPSFYFVKSVQHPAIKTLQLNYITRSISHVIYQSILSALLNSRLFSKPFIIFENLRWLCDLET